MGSHPAVNIISHCGSQAECSLARALARPAARQLQRGDLRAEDAEAAARALAAEILIISVEMLI